MMGWDATYWKAMPWSHHAAVITAIFSEGWNSFAFTPILLAAFGCAHYESIPNEKESEDEDSD